MVEIVNNNGVVSIESTVCIDEEFAKKIKQIDKKQLKALLKDLHIDHRLEEKEGTVLSIVGTSVDGSRVPLDGTLSGIKTIHHIFFERIKEMCKETPSTCEEEDSEEEDFLLYAGMSALTEVLNHIDADCMIIVKRKNDGKA